MCNFQVKSSAICHLNGLFWRQRYCHWTWRHGNTCFGKMALKGGIVYIPMGCSINVFSPVVNGCEREHLNRFDHSVLRCKWSSANLFLTKTGKLPCPRNPLWCLRFWDGSRVLTWISFCVWPPASLSAETTPTEESTMLIQQHNPCAAQTGPILYNEVLCVH